MNVICVLAGSSREQQMSACYLKWMSVYIGCVSGWLQLDGIWVGIGEVMIPHVGYTWIHAHRDGIHIHTTRTWMVHIGGYIV